MHQDQQEREYFTTAVKRSKTRLIVAVHLLIVALFFVATFFWGNFE
mgnify:CR=1 FL=1